MHRKNENDHVESVSGKSQKFIVTITEILERTVEVEADNPRQAERIVSNDWHNSRHILGSEDFSDVSFDAVFETEPS